MSRAKKLIASLVVAASLSGAALTGASAEVLTEEGCVAFQGNTCTLYQVCQYDTDTGQGICYYYHLSGGRYKYVAYQEF
jgi:hypothetical protein